MALSPFLTAGESDVLSLFERHPQPSDRTLQEADAAFQYVASVSDATSERNSSGVSMSS